VRWALRPRTDQRSFGNHRGTILAAFMNAALLGVVTVAIVATSVDRLVHPSAVHGRVVVVVAAIALAVNGLAALALWDRSGDLNIRSALVHMAGDAAASTAALVAGVVVVAFGEGFERADPIASLVVSLLICVEAVRLLRGSADVLLESTPRDIDLGALRQTITRAGAVSDVHDLHVWSLSSEVRALSAHLVLPGHPSLEEAQVVGQLVRSRVAADFGIAHTTLELECERCEDVADPCEMDEVGSVPIHGASHT